MYFPVMEQCSICKEKNHIDDIVNYDGGFCCRYCNIVYKLGLVFPDKKRRFSKKEEN